jgi:hypothetical protein
VAPIAATATADPSGLYALLVLGLTVWVAGWLLTCWLYPFTNCRRCRGTGKNRSPFGARAFGLCRRCDGTGRQLRIGRHILNNLRGLHARDTTHRRNPNSRKGDDR